jgi:hypothetical protein
VMIVRCIVITVGGMDMSRHGWAPTWSGRGGVSASSLPRQERS